MFGMGWASGEARVVSLRLLSKSFDGGSGQSFSANEYMLDVRPDDGSPAFRGTAKDPFNMINWRQPSEGDVVRVKYHAKNHEVKFDRDDPVTHVDNARKAFKKEVKAAHTAEAEQRWKEMAAGAPTGHVESDVEHRERVIASEPAPSSAALAATAASIGDMQATLTAINAAKAAGNRAEVDRLKAEFAGRAAERSSPVGHPADSGPLLAARPAAGDHIERLEQLAGLHDRGVLTDAEFAAEKAKLLSEG